jgi:DNA end-binding protein Ku
MGRLGREAPDVRTLWKGAISFSLVHIPVRVYAATEKRGLKFRQLHRQCLSPIHYLKWCPTCRRETPLEEIASGYEFRKGEFVVLEDEDLDSLPAAETKLVSILDFVDLAEIDPLYYDKAYYLEPGEGGAKAYALLRRAMLETARIAVARVTVRTRPSLATIRVFDRTVLVMETMHWPDEIRSYAALSGLGPTPLLEEGETRMADLLIGSLSAPFDPAKYTDEYRARVQEIIRAKAEGQRICTLPGAGPAPVLDLMEALRASVAAAEAARRGQTDGAPPNGMRPAGP